ncbi:GNAT family N-acetyltransferase [Desulfatiglans anilini]|uniref:GNAT family N-acetyltransferase n=1 Tax=Desulfatiglans anilini TaxID=90728 RepID=UPI0004135B1D|nr:GNAT family N-acetyltransferase [Desulfatiglans anilini]
MFFEDRHLPGGLVLGLFKPEDAPGIVECYRNVHGDSFPVPDVYDAAAIIAHNSGDRCYTLVVRTPEGRVVGLAALHLVEQHRRVFEARQLMVAKDYRRRNLAKILNDANIGELPALVSAGAVFSELVCNTPASQKLVRSTASIPRGWSWSACRRRRAPMFRSYICIRSFGMGLKPFICLSATPLLWRIAPPAWGWSGSSTQGCGRAADPRPWPRSRCRLRACCA